MPWKSKPAPGGQTKVSANGTVSTSPSKRFSLGNNLNRRVSLLRLPTVLKKKTKLSFHHESVSSGKPRNRHSGLKAQISRPVTPVPEFMFPGDLSPDIKTLYFSINSTRRFEDKRPLQYNPELALREQNHAEQHVAQKAKTHIETKSLFSNGPRPQNRYYPVGYPRHTRLTYDLEAESVVLIPPKGMGAMACGELWYGGKYITHKFHGRLTHERMEQAQAILSGTGKVKKGDGDGVVEEPEQGMDCICQEFRAWDALTGDWMTVGIGRGADGTWVAVFEI